MKDIKIRRDQGKIEKRIIKEYEKIVGYKFPIHYINLISKHNGLRLKERNTFKYYDEVVKREEENGIYFYAFANENLDPLYCDGIVGDFSYIDENDFPKGVFPFGGTGNGDYICFDYRKDLKTNNPKIVLLHHDAPDIDNNLIISFLSNSFEEFMDSLYDYKE